MIENTETEIKWPKTDFDINFSDLLENLYFLSLRVILQELVLLYDLRDNIILRFINKQNKLLIQYVIILYIIHINTYYILSILWIGWVRLTLKPYQLSGQPDPTRLTFRPKSWLSSQLSSDRPDRSWVLLSSLIDPTLWLMA
jgi:hypothetical protein